MGVYEVSDRVDAIRPERDLILRYIVRTKVGLSWDLYRW